MTAPGQDEVRHVGFAGIAEHRLVDKLKALGADRLPVWLRLALAAVALGAVGGLGVVFLSRAASTRSPAALALPRAVRIATTAAASPQLVVQISGAVSKPGVYTMADGSRLADLVTKAGGAVADADTTRLNLAGKLSDGQAIVVAHLGEVAPLIDPIQGSGGGVAGRVRPDDPVDLNRSTAEQLQTLPGVGPATAAAIVRYRQSRGPFASIDDLLDVPGIGPAKLEALRSRARV